MTNIIKIKLDHHENVLGAELIAFPANKHQVINTVTQDSTLTFARFGICWSLGFLSFSCERKTENAIYKLLKCPFISNAPDHSSRVEFWESTGWSTSLTFFKIHKRQCKASQYVDRVSTLLISERSQQYVGFVGLICMHGARPCYSLSAKTQITHSPASWRSWKSHRYFIPVQPSKLSNRPYKTLFIFKGACNT